MLSFGMEYERAFLDRVREREVRGGVRPALPRGDDQRPRELREELAALLVRLRPSCA
jgi:hypothetical protein